MKKYLLPLSFFALITSAHAYSFTENFDSLPIGDVTSGGWTSFGNNHDFQVENTISNSTPNALKVHVGNYNFAYRSITPPTSHIQYRYKMYWDGTSNTTGWYDTFSPIGPSSSSFMPNNFIPLTYDGNTFFTIATTTQPLVSQPIVGWNNVLLDARYDGSDYWTTDVYMNGNETPGTSTNMGIIPSQQDIISIGNATFSQYTHFAFDDFEYYSDGDIPAMPAEYSFPLNSSDFSGYVSWFDHDATSSQMTRYDGSVFYGIAAEQGPCTEGVGCYDGHHGIDLGTGGVEGKAVLAAATGTVATLKWENPSDHAQGYGYYMRIYHPQYDQSTIYAHATTTGSFFAVNDDVARGDTILLSGSTGEASAPHLHFGVTVGDTTDPTQTIDPFGWTGTSTDPRANDKGYLWVPNIPSP